MSKVCESCGMTRWEARQVEGWIEAERAENARLRKTLEDIASVNDSSMAISLACAALADVSAPSDR